MTGGKGTFSAISLALVIGCFASQLRAQEPFQPEYQKYLSQADFKAFAVAIDDTGAWACGYGYRARTEQEAKALALSECQKRAHSLLVSANCKLIAVGGVRIAGASPQEVAVGATYEVKWVNGTSFVVGTSGSLQLWVAFTVGHDPQGLFYLVNGSDIPLITFFPEAIKATVTRAEKKGTTQTPVRVYGAAEYEKKVRTKQAWQAALFGAASALANQPQPQTTTVQGRYNSTQIFHPENQVLGTFSGQITSWPSASDYAAAQERSNAQIEAMASQLHASYRAMASTLLRTNTLEPGTYYGGIVHFGRVKGSKIVLNVPYGGATFIVSFTLP